MWDRSEPQGQEQTKVLILIMETKELAFIGQ